MAKPTTVIASCACHDCGERCQIKLNRNYIAYYFCACGASHRFNRPTSADLDRKYENLQRKNAHASKETHDQIRTTGPAVAAVHAAQEPGKAEAIKARYESGEFDAAPGSGERNATGGNRRPAEPVGNHDQGGGTSPNAPTGTDAGAEPRADAGDREDFLESLYG